MFLIKRFHRPASNTYLTIALPIILTILAFMIGVPPEYPVALIVALFLATVTVTVKSIYPFAPKIERSLVSDVAIPGKPLEVTVRVKNGVLPQAIKVWDIRNPRATYSGSTEWTVLLGPLEEVELKYTVTFPERGPYVLPGLGASVGGPFHAVIYPVKTPHIVSVFPRVTVLRRLKMRPYALRYGAHTVRERRGPGTEFLELREYRPGDPFKSIEWKALARTGKLYTKEMHFEATPDYIIYLDASPSMALGTPTAKIEYATTLAASIAETLIKNGGSLGLVAYSHRRYWILEPKTGIFQYRRALEFLAGVFPDVGTDAIPAGEARHKVRDFLKYVGLNVPVEGLGKILSSRLPWLTSLPEEETIALFAYLNGIVSPRELLEMSRQKNRVLKEVIERVGGEWQSHKPIVITDTVGVPAEFPRMRGHTIILDDLAFGAVEESFPVADIFWSVFGASVSRINLGDAWNRYLHDYAVEIAKKGSTVAVARPEHIWEGEI
ncbi:MAG: hypothetical protein PWP76_55 [Candidatus Diapherotrites archaeon]|nr:hypothetical protein [Candidatus Diapherotrites archaeon]MDN5366966.1 hypothetical protein [Candidatus Diapherotrites archaeon]